MKANITAATLNQAAEIIEENGWCQGHFATTTARLCLVGALRAASGIDPTNIQENSTLNEAACGLIGWLYPEGLDGVDEYELLVVWNDADGRTAEQVTAALRSAAREVG